MVTHNIATYYRLGQVQAEGPTTQAVITLLIDALLINLLANHTLLCILQKVIC